MMAQAMMAVEFARQFCQDYKGRGVFYKTEYDRDNEVCNIVYRHGRVTSRVQLYGPIVILETGYHESIEKALGLKPQQNK